MGEPMAVASPAAHVSPGDTDSMRLCLALQQEELGQIQQPDFATAETDGMDDETRATLELAWRLEQEERARLQEQTAAAERLANEPEDTDSLALAIRLQQEDDEQALRNVIGVLPPDEGSEPGSPSQYTYEQLMRLGETIGEVSKGAAAEDIAALRTMSYDEASADSTVILGEQCSICRMEYESDDTLRVLGCGHAEHAECLDQWLAVNKACPLCQVEVSKPALGMCAPCATPVAASP